MALVTCREGRGRPTAGPLYLRNSRLRAIIDAVISVNNHPRRRNVRRYYSKNINVLLGTGSPRIIIISSIVQSWSSVRQLVAYIRTFLRSSIWVCPRTAKYRSRFETFPSARPTCKRTFCEGKSWEKRETRKTKICRVVMNQEIWEILDRSDPRRGGRGKNGNLLSLELIKGNVRIDIVGSKFWWIVGYRKGIVTPNR